MAVEAPVQVEAAAVQVEALGPLQRQQR